MKRTLLFSSILLASQAYGSGGVNIGQSMTTGPSSNQYSLSASSNNPAMTSLVVGDGENLRMSYFPSLSIGIELGDVDNIVEELEDLTDLIDGTSTKYDHLSAEEQRARFNLVLKDLGESGYIKNSVSLNAPIFPLFFNSELLGGSVGVSISANFQAGLSVLDDELTYNNQNGSYSTATSIYIKSGIEKAVSLSYSREVPAGSWFKGHGTLYGGVKLKAMNIELSKQIIPLETLDSGDISDIIKDEYDNNQKSSTEFGIDLGVVWDADDYRLGLTIENINSPEFEYGDVGVNCASIPQNTMQRTACEAAAYFAQVKGDIKSKEVYTKHAYARADVLWKLTERWQVTSAMDLAEYDDVVGFENQWLHVATSYDAEHWLMPSGRIGYHKNLVGSEIASVSFGATWFNVALDFEYGLETIEVDGSKVPRRVGFALSIEESF